MIETRSFEYRSGVGTLRNTAWDRRALGFGTAEILQLPPDPIDVRACLDEMQRLCEQWDAHYIYGRVSTDRVIRKTLEEVGFALVETSLSLGSGPHSDLPRVSSSLVPDLVTPDRVQLQEAIGIATEDFHHGRFLEDPEIDEASARSRTGFWLRDLASAGEAQVAVHKGRVIGFYCDAVDDARHQADLVLAGVRSGSELLALPMWVTALARLRHRGVRRTKTMVSASNVGVLNLYGLLGFRVEAVHLGYRKFLR